MTPRIRPTDANPTNDDAAFDRRDEQTEQDEHAQAARDRAAEKEDR